MEAPALFPALVTAGTVVWLAWSQRKPLPCPSCKWSDGGCNKLPAPDCGEWEQWRVDYD